ncbi:MAG: GNAT family N-acetyltransferase [Faecousia sp.]
MIQLRKINAQNIWEIVALEVAESQKSFVATNTESILEAYCAITNGGTALPFGIYDGDTPVGFTMISYGCDDWEDAPAIARDNYAIWRLMIDQRFQGKGYGKAAMAAILDFIRTFPRGKAEYCMLSYEPENTVAKALYHSFGFRENGEMDGDEIVAVLKLCTTNA